MLYLRDRDPVDGHSKFDEALYWPFGLWLINDNIHRKMTLRPFEIYWRRHILDNQERARS